MTEGERETESDWQRNRKAELTDAEKETKRAAERDSSMKSLPLHPQRTYTTVSRHKQYT